MVIPHQWSRRFQIFALDVCNPPPQSKEAVSRLGGWVLRVGGGTWFSVT